MAGVEHKARIKRVMVLAAKKAILEYPLEKISARNVAKESGYSYATIYNYFSDFNALLWYALLEILQELRIELGVFTEKEKLSQKEFRQAWQEYSAFFLDHPNVYRLFFTVDIGLPPEEHGPLSDEPGFALLLLPKLGLPELQEGKVRLLWAARNLALSVQGILNLFLSGKTGWTRQATLLRVDENVNYFLECQI